MTSSNDKTDGKKPLKLKRPNTLELKKTVETGQVQQSFSHGRSKAVTVEVKRSRTFERNEAGRMKAVPAGSAAPAAEKPAEKPAPKAEKPGASRPKRSGGNNDRGGNRSPAPASKQDVLTDAEREKRLRVLEAAKKADEEKKILEEQRRIEEQERAAREAEDRARREAEATKEREREERERREMEEEEKRIAAAQTDREKGEREAKDAARAAADARKRRENGEDPVAVAKDAKEKKGKSEPASVEEMLANSLGGRVKQKKNTFNIKQTAKPSAEPERRRGKLSIAEALDEDRGGRQRSLASVKRQREKQKAQERGGNVGGGRDGGRVVREVTLPETITVQELANRMAERGTEVIKKLMKMGVMATINQIIDADTAELVIEEFGHTVKRVTDADIEDVLISAEDTEEQLQARAPVVTVMGHVDHGKTSLLDAIRSADVVSGEAGGITQHIGAYQVRLSTGEPITFLDTPGHAAFTEMRLRGANVTDVVVLVVAADDGIMEQTVEAISHAKAAEVPIIVAINKCDKPEANPDRVKQELLQHELIVEDMGGDILAIEVSAKTRQGLDKLEEAILLQSELLELKANPDRSAVGTVVESRLDKGRGALASILIQKGTLNVGDVFVTGTEWGRVRAMVNERGQKVKQAGPSQPVEVLGLNGVPNAGEDFIVVEEGEAKARNISEFRSQRAKELDIAKSSRGTLEQMLARLKEGSVEELPVIIKADVHGSMEAIATSLNKLGTDEVKVNILHSGVGALNESDITLANSTGALVIAFNVRANPQARDLARQEKVDIRYYSIIYNVVDDVKAAMSGLLEPEQREKFLGYAEIREIFKNSKVGKVAGCMVTDGIVQRGAKVRLLRDNVVIHDGTLKTLRRFKDEVKEVREGYECGMAFENYSDIQPGDQIECYIIEEIAREL
ncbi:translation initiation factor IF-2 [Kiloniella sp. b19]|uniref:translation initiation factor IF-2 n=1 Tax=Kiloniella sp. GXU_MW_B19 TaxID=3141326 RepID=UPI0031CFCEDC